MDSSPQSATPRRRRRGWRILAWLLGIIVVLLVAAYFIGSSSAFFKGVILPRVSRALNADVTVAEASIHPFREVTLRQLKVQARGYEPLLTAPEVRVRYSLMAILGGTVRIDEAVVTDPVVAYIENPDGRSNLDPILQAQQKPTAPETKQPAKPSGKPSKPAQIDVRRVSVTGATIRKLKLYPGGYRDLLELTNANATIENLKNSQTGKLSFNTRIQAQNRPPPPQTNGLLSAGCDGAFNFGLGPDLKPVFVEGRAQAAVTSAGAAWADLAGFAATFTANVSPAEVKEVAGRISRDGESLGELVAAGPFSLEKREGQLDIELRSVDRRALNLAAAGTGFEFGPTRISSTNRLQAASSGRVVTVSGRFDIGQLQLTHAGQTTPSLDLRAVYDATADLAASNAVVRVLTVNGAQNQSPILQGELARPMTVTWGNNSSGPGDSEFTVNVTRLDLADWGLLLGSNASSGELNARARIQSQSAGNLLKFDLDSTVTNLTATLGTDRIANATLAANMRGEAAELKRFSISESRLSLGSPGEPALSLTATGTYDAGSRSVDAQVALEAALPRLSRLVAHSDLAFTSGAMVMQARAALRNEAQNLTGTLALTNVAGQSGKRAFDRVDATMNFDLGVANKAAQLRTLRLALSPTDRAKNELQMQGTLDFSRTNALEGDLKLAADSLDVTRYYDLLGGQSEAGGKKAAGKTAAARHPAPPPQADREPEAQHWPVRRIALQADIGRLYLRELELTNLATAVQVEASRVRLDPLRLALNGAPIQATADLDLGVPGYRYALAFSADRIPVAPLADSFAEEYRGHARGELIADVRLDGAGITGVQLQRSLSGKAGLVFTNANIELVGKPRLIIIPIAAALKLPELADTPLNWFASNIEIADGVIRLADVHAVGPAFAAETEGVIPIAPVLTNSPIRKLPIRFALSRSMAERINSAGVPGADTNSPYVDLGVIAHLTGTLGDPKADPDYARIALITAQQFIGGDAGKILKDIGGLLPGAPKPATTNAPPAERGTNQPALTPGGLLRDLLGPKPK